MCSDDSIELVQRIWDVTRYCRHSDPSVVAAAASLVGRYMAAIVTIQTSTQLSQPPSLARQDTYEETGDKFSKKSALVPDDSSESPCRGPISSLPSQASSSVSPISIDSLLDLLKEVLMNDSAVVARGGITALRGCLPTLLRCLEVPYALSLLPALVASARHPYWLNKVELCDALALLPLAHIDFLEQECVNRGSTHLKGGPLLMGVTGLEGHFSHRVLLDVLLTLLADSDVRVRTAACKAIAR